MTIKEIIEARAREAATEVWSRFKTCWPELVGDYRQDSNPPAIERIIQSALIAILTDPAVGFKEALETINRMRSGNVCADCVEGHHPSFVCTCPCHSAEAKLKELKEMSK